MKLLDQLIAERAEISAMQTALVNRAADEVRDLTEDEDKNLADFQDRASTLDRRIEDLRQMQEATLKADAMRAEVRALNAENPTEEPATGQAVVKEEKLTYRQDNQNDVSFVKDFIDSVVSKDVAASERIQRHQQEMLVTRDGTSSNYAGLVVPQYLTDLAAPLARAGRPFADQCRNLPLPDSGMTLNISRVTTGASAAVQAAENDAVSETDIDDTLLTSNISTVASGQQLSRQAMERGTGIDALVTGDMASAMSTTLDNQLINGSGSSGQLLGISQVTGINAVTYTDGSPTVAEFYPKLLDAIQQINSNIYRAPDLIVMHPRRLAWLQAGVDGNSRPLVLPQTNVPQNAMGTGPVAGYGNTGSQIAGIPIVTDANIRTDLGAGTEDAVYVVSRSDMLLFEDGDMMMRMDETAGLNLTLTLVMYSYVGFVPGRYPAAISAITGTGLIAPSF
jgi:HK97 family phage major capsid protein